VHLLTEDYTACRNWALSYYDVLNAKMTYELQPARNVHSSKKFTDWTNLSKFWLNGAAARVNVLTMQTILCLSRRLNAVKLAEDSQEIQSVSHSTKHTYHQLSVSLHIQHSFILPHFTALELQLTAQPIIHNTTCHSHHLKDYFNIMHF